MPDRKSRDPIKTAEQARLQAGFTFEYVGNGPAATGTGKGWSMNRKLYFKCTTCGYMMLNDTDDYDNCFCGAMHLDCDSGRFGSDLGDDAIEVYIPKIRESTY